MLGCRERRWKFALLLFNGRVVCASSIGASVGVFRGGLLVLDIPDLFMGSRVKYFTHYLLPAGTISQLNNLSNTRAAAPSMATPTLALQLLPWQHQHNLI